MNRPVRAAPNADLKAWPNEPSSDPAVEAVRIFALNVRAARDGRSTRQIADLCGVSHVTVQRALNGDAWPDAATIARLEHGLGVTLWPTYKQS